MGRWEEQRSSPSVDLLVPARVWGGVAESREWSCRKRRRPSIAVDVLSWLSSIHRSMASNDVLTFVKGHSDAEMMESGKVRCLVTGHEMPARLDAIQQHFNGKRYKNAKARAKYDFKKHEPWIVEHKKNPHLLYCTLTKQPVTKQERAVEGHINGKKYKRLLAEALNPTEKKPSKKALAREAASMKRRRGNAEHNREDIEDLGEGEELEDDDDGVDTGGSSDDKASDDGDAAEFLEEGPFWEREGNSEDEDDDDEVDDDEDGEEENDDDEEEDDRVDADEGGAVSGEGDDDVFWTRPKIAVVGSKSGADLDALNKPNKRQRGDDGSRRKAPVNTELTPRELKPNKRELKSKMRHRGSMDGEADGEKQPRPLTASPNLASVSAKQAMAVPLMALQGEAEKPLKKAKTGQIVKGGMKAHKGKRQESLA